MFVCPVLKISQVKMKRRHRASHLGRDALWHNGHQATTQLGRFTLCGTKAAQLHNSVDLLCGTTAAEPNNPVSLNDACTRSRTHFPKTVTNHAENVKA